MSESKPVIQLDELGEAARRARESAHAPYSRYRVGAAVRTRSGAVYAGCNVENASYGATICAERAAVAAMVVAGEREILAVTVFTDDGPLGMPCGICRQTLLEFAGPECVVVVSSLHEARQTTLGALLPEPFVFRP